ncbi:GNAT family N-acetyltransferase [Streptomyces misionensis]|uniref:GNAT family N-acetyltransferase n=1 Tax=Streptomyces misionensis TaxID=67331 RepID=UPI0033A5BF6F
MRPDDWHLTEDAADFLARAGDFLRSRPALHTMALTVCERLRTHGTRELGPGSPLFGLLESDGRIDAAFFHLPSRGLNPTPLTSGQADALAARLAAVGHTHPYVTADHETATAYAKAWHRHTGATPAPRIRIRLYRLGTLTPPDPFPAGRPRPSSACHRDQLLRWVGEFAESVGETPTTADSWPTSRFADKHFTFWEAPDGTPVSLAGSTSPIGGMVRVDPVYTPSRLRGRGYASAVTAEVTRAALTAGATDVVLFADPANPTSNALYQRLGYERLTDWAVYDFSQAVSSKGGGG